LVAGNVADTRVGPATSVSEALVSTVASEVGSRLATVGSAVYSGVTTTTFGEVSVGSFAHRTEVSKLGAPRLTIAPTTTKTMTPATTRPANSAP
jgi:hypothetical protein